MPPVKKAPQSAETPPTAPEVESAPQAPAETDLLAANLAVVQHANANAFGHAKVVHHLEVAFVHALAGAKDKALADLTAAEAEFQKFAPNLQDLAHEYALLKARVHALLGRK